MILENKYPIFEFDDNKDAKLNPTAFVRISITNSDLKKSKEIL